MMNQQQNALSLARVNVSEWLKSYKQPNQSDFVCMKLHKNAYQFLRIIPVLICCCYSYSWSSGDGRISRAPNVCSDSQSVALKFMNSYVVKKFSAESEMIDWVSRNDLLTKKFKFEYRKLLTDARKNDPELGLDFDPILDAQDQPDSGFVLKKLLDDGYAVIAGKDWKEFEVTVHLVLRFNKCIVDGSGVINIPDKLRSTR